MLNYDSISFSFFKKLLDKKKMSFMVWLYVVEIFLKLEFNVQTFIQFVGKTKFYIHLEFECLHYNLCTELIINSNDLFSLNLAVSFNHFSQNTMHIVNSSLYIIIRTQVASW